MRSQINVHLLRGLLNNGMDRCKISKWEVALGVPDRVNIPSLNIDTCHSQKEKSLPIIKNM